MLDFIVLLVAILVGAVFEPQTFEQELISWIVILSALVFEAIRFSVWSKREQLKAERDNKRIYREIVEREFRRNGF